MKQLDEGALIRFGDIAFNETNGAMFVILGRPRYDEDGFWTALALGHEAGVYIDPFIASIWLGSPAVTWRLYRA